MYWVRRQLAHLLPSLLLTPSSTSLLPHSPPYSLINPPYSLIHLLTPSFTSLLPHPPHPTPSFTPAHPTPSSTSPYSLIHLTLLPHPPHPTSQWMANNWQIDECYTRSGVDGSRCSFQRYLSEVSSNSECPDLVVELDTPGLSALLDVV